MTRAAGSHLPERLKHGIRDLSRSRRLPMPLGHGTHRAWLVCDFVNGPKVLADCGAWNLACDKKYRRGA